MWLTAILEEHKWTWVIPTLITGAFVALAGSSWVDSRIDMKTAGLSEQVTRIELRQIEKEIREIKSMLCKDPGERRLINAMEELQRDYQHLVGYRYDPPGCDVLAMEFYPDESVG